jgi:hypothetical protein
MMMPWIVRYDQVGVRQRLAIDDPTFKFPEVCKCPLHVRGHFSIARSIGHIDINEDQASVICPLWQSPVQQPSEPESATRTVFSLD